MLNHQVTLGVDLPPLVALAIPAVRATDHGFEMADGRSWAWAMCDSCRAAERIRLGRARDVEVVLDEFAALAEELRIPLGVRVIDDAEWYESQSGISGAPSRRSARSAS